MKNLQQWLSEYGESHQNRTNKIIHYICVPAIFMTVIGLLWSVPFPAVNLPNYVNWATLLLVPALIFYFRLSLIVGFGMTATSIVMVLFVAWWESNITMSVLVMSVTVFVIAWVLQFIGHKIEGKKPSFFKDVQFLLIGPAWIFCHLFGLGKEQN